jgi:hypothetical protein
MFICFTKIFSVVNLIYSGQEHYSYFMFTVFYQVKCTLFYIEYDTEMFPAHYTWKEAEKGFKMAFMMNRLAMINSCEIILEK